MQSTDVDLDFTVEGNAIEFTEYLQQQYGGETRFFAAFGTAKWILTEEVAQSLALDFSQLPHHIDIATTRTEIYDYPTALPTVQPSDLQHDLKRRDFTINALAIQLSPQAQAWQLIDLFNGLQDLQQKQLHVLHDQSFIDDPTRILRAGRFASRFDFELETHTYNLLKQALPMLARITGERIRNELVLALQEKNPAKTLLLMDSWGIFQVIHPDFQLPENIELIFELIATNAFEWIAIEDPADLYWHSLFAHIPPAQLHNVCERLLIFGKQQTSLLEASNLIQEQAFLASPQTKPSEIVKRVANIPEISLVTVWVVCQQNTVRQNIENYFTQWRSIHSHTTGRTLQSLGLKPGRHYQTILNELRDAWLDGTIQSVSEEIELRDKLLRKAQDNG
jgi:tRNA nucleotidyltransferase (CCA-adding enzyme)